MRGSAAGGGMVPSDEGEESLRVRKSMEGKEKAWQGCGRVGGGWEGRGRSPGK